MVTDHEFDPFIAKIAGELKEPVRLDARFDERVMAALEPEVISLASRRAQQPWYRRSFSVSAPLGAFAAAAALAGIAAVGVMATRQVSESQVAAVPAQDLVPVANQPVDPATLLQPQQFYLAEPSATSVSLIGHFNDWKPDSTPMVYDEAHGAWSVTILLPPGRYEYQFLVDGSKHVNDPTAPQQSGDFGSPNSVVNVRIRQ
ncbi:MAG: isoamylase early set domain-containing protein [Gemmatimonadaceae bacterium]